MFRELIGELAVISVIAAVAEMLLPETGGHRPVYFVFGLYLIALLLNPVVKFWTETDLTAVDFSALAEERVVSVADDSVLSEVYRSTAEELETEINRKLKVLYPQDEFEVKITMTENGFEKVILYYDDNEYGSIAERKFTDIKRMLAADYGIGEELISLYRKGAK